MTLSLASNTIGSFTIVGTSASGNSTSIPTFGNILTIISSVPSADSDVDGLTNIYETAIGSNPFLASTTADGIPDGWALFYGLNPSNAGGAGQTAPNGLTYLQSFLRGLNPL